VNRAQSARKPASWWLVLAAVFGMLTAVCLIAAIVLQRQASTPKGEGELFVTDAETAGQVIRQAANPEEAVRLARNRLEIEAVSLLDGSGVVVASTSPPLEGKAPENQLIAGAAADHSFIAVATAVGDELWMDGVVQWPAGTVLYQVVSPLDGDRSVLLHYDVSELLGRRSRPGEIPAASVQLLGLGGLFAILGVAVFIGHSRAARRYRRLALESDLLRIHSAQLEEANRELDSARHQAEEALALAEEKIRIRSEFVLMINHELRTPLTSVVTGAELLRSTRLSDRDREVVLDSMVADGARLQEIIDQILAVARIENRGLSYELVDVPFDLFADAVANAHRTDIAVRAAGDGADLAVTTDVKAVSLVVASLVDNALTHGATTVSLECSTGDGITPDLEVGQRPQRAVHVIVTDDGPGIQPEFLPRIFEKFEKSSFSSGTGLGLYMARMIVEAIDGSLAVQTSSRGSRFQISLPAVRLRQVVRTG
jgi:signal transduction histidine kinase